MIKDITKKFLLKENNYLEQMTSRKTLDFMQKHNDFQNKNKYSIDNLEMVNIISQNQKSNLNKCNYLIFDIRMVYCEKGKDSFEIGEIEVTQELYQKVMGKNPSGFKNLPKSPRHPVENVSWYDAIMFCNKLSVLFGLSKYYTIRDEKNEIVNEIKKDTNYKVEINENSKGYRLPFDEEWLYASREYKGGKKLSKDEEIGRAHV